LHPVGWCQDFSVEIADGCTHPMRPGLSYCSCDECGVVCQGKFEGCPEVWLQLSVTAKDEHHAKHPAPSRRGAGDHRHSIRLAEPMEVPDSSPPPVVAPARPARIEPAAPRPRVEVALESAPVPATGRRADVEQPAKEWLAGMVGAAVHAGLAEQAAVTDLRFTHLHEALAQIEAEAATDAAQLVERLKNLLARHHEVVEARLGSYQSELDALRMVVSRLTERAEPDDAEHRGDPSAGVAPARLEETVAALTEQNEELRGRLATQESLVDNLHRAVSDLMAAPGRLDQGVMPGSSVPPATEEVNDLRREVVRLRSEIGSAGEAFRRSVDEMIGAVESRGDEVEARITARIERALTSKFARGREPNHQHEELVRELAARQAELEDRMVAQRQTLVAIQGAVAKLALRKDVALPTPLLTPVADDDRGGRRFDVKRQSQAPSGPRGDVSALLGAHWYGKAEAPGGDRGDPPPGPEDAGPVAP
jgi:hypothetical protein